MARRNTDISRTAFPAFVYERRAREVERKIAEYDVMVQDLLESRGISTDELLGRLSQYLIRPLRDEVEYEINKFREEDKALKDDFISKRTAIIRPDGSIDEEAHDELLDDYLDDMRELNREIEHKIDDFEVLKENYYMNPLNYINPSYGQGKSMTHRESVLKTWKLEDKSYSLKKLASITSVPLSTLQEVYDRGIGAYSTQPKSVRLKGSFVKNVDAPMKKKLSPQQWAMARVYSFLNGNPKHDNDLRKNIESMTGGELVTPEDYFNNRYPPNINDDVPENYEQRKINTRTDFLNKYIVYLDRGYSQDRDKAMDEAYKDSMRHHDMKSYRPENYEKSCFQKCFGKGRFYKKRHLVSSQNMRGSY